MYTISAQIGTVFEVYSRSWGSVRADPLIGSGADTGPPFLVNALQSEAGRAGPVFMNSNLHRMGSSEGPRCTALGKPWSALTSLGEPELPPKLAKLSASRPHPPEIPSHPIKISFREVWRNFVLGSWDLGAPCWRRLQQTYENIHEGF